MRDIGKNIRDLRERAKLTQDALAEQLCTTRQTISNYERGKTRPDVEQILRLAAIFGTDANAILYGPPGAEHRRDARLRTVLSGMIWGVLQTGYWLLTLLQRSSIEYI
ncbi:MAG: helix-turn-helix transcriptional regulator [Oscillospiraceae bacterium]